MGSDEIKCKQLTKTQAAYIAGILDGEGCITLSRSGKYLRPLVSVVNTKKELLEYLVTSTGLGKVLVSKRPSKTSNIPYRWQIWSKQSSLFLIQVLPFLVIKKQQAILLLNFANRSNTKHGRNGLSKDDVNHQTSIYNQLKKLNKRGGRID